MKYKVIGFKAVLFDGVFGLSDKQAAIREHAVKKLDDGKYQVLSPVEFKTGEVIEYDGELPKSLFECLEEVETKRGRKPKEDEG